MKKTTYLFALLVAMSCQQKQTDNGKSSDTTSIKVPQMVGNDLDKHGCKGSAGYTWSVAKNECVKVFEVGVRLDAQDSTLNKTLSAFAVFANDKEESNNVEIFLPSLKDSSLILKPVKDNGAGTWSNGTFTLTQWKGMYSLEEGKKTIYQGHR